MGREIKVRAWDNKEKQFVTEYDTGKYSTYIEFFGDGDVRAFYKNLTCHCSPEGCGGCDDEWVEAKDVTLTQCLGLEDKNGVEYYCGDIGVFDNGDIFVIKTEEWIEFYVDWISEPKCEDQARDLYRIRKALILGNIYENSILNILLEN